MKEVEQVMKIAISNKMPCPVHCRRWTYRSSSSFYDLQRREEIDEGRMYSRIHIFYADFTYHQYEHVPETTLYLVFCDFANVVALYLGMSTISFFHVGFYVVRYWYVRIKIRGRAKVAPAVEDH